MTATGGSADVDSILVIGGTGNVGVPLLGELLARGRRVRVLSRRSPDSIGLPAAIDVVTADIVADPWSARDAFAGIGAVFMLNGASLQESVEGMLAVDLARDAGVSRFVYQSSHCIDELAHIPHLAPKLAIERAIAASGMRYTFLRPNHFFQNDRACLPRLRSERVYVQPIGSVGCDRVDVRDIALAAAIVLTQDGHDGRTYNLVGPERLTGPACAELWAQALGFEVAWEGGIAAWQTGASRVLPAWLVYDLGMMYRRISEHGMLAALDDLADFSALIGQPPRRFSDYVSETAAS